MLVLITLMYLPWLLYFFGSKPEPGDEGMEFPGGILFAVFGLGYLVVAIILPFLLYGQRRLSIAHGIAYYASLGILAMFTVVIWRSS